MIDPTTVPVSGTVIAPGTGAVIAATLASIVALSVGVIGAMASRRTALDAARVAERARALLRLLHIVELNGRGVQERVFNLTQARRSNDDGRDPVTREWDDAYAPLPRPARPVSSDELAEASALLAAYGTDLIDSAYEAWAKTLERIDEVHLHAEHSYLEEQTPPTPELFTYVIGLEQASRRELGVRVRQLLRRGRVKKFRWRRPETQMR